MILGKDSIHIKSESAGIIAGFNGLIGLAHAKGLFAEAKVGALNSPSFKFAVGYTFH